MKHWAWAGTAIVVALAAWPGVAGASGDYGCTPSWTLAVSSLDCAGSAVIGPRNDTRVNLAFLLRDQAGISAPGKLAYPKWDWDNGDFGHVFLDWAILQSAFWPKPATTGEPHADEPAYAGSRCQTLASGGEAFRAALAQAKDLKPDERDALGAARDLVKPACDGDKTAPLWPTVAGKAAQAWLGYLQGALAFYADDFPTARARFADVAQAKDPWLAETARYMIARNELAAAQVGAFDEWGGYAGSDKVDRVSAERGGAALQDYLTAYRRGRYTASAEGLTRRAAWLLGEGPALARTYSGLLADPSRSPAMLEPAMLEEVESKVFFGVGMGNDANAPLLLATWDLLRMRQEEPDAYALNPAPAALTAQELAAQAQVFARQPALYTFLQANLAYHVTKDYRRVLALIPDDARAKSYTPLAFSGQMLRGLALEKLGDRNAPAFFQQVASGAQDLYQRPAAQLALAMHWERSGELAKVFAPASPITEPELRTMLLAHVAGPELLRARSTDRTASLPEREVAAFTLLTKDLSHGRYADFSSDLARVPKGAASISGSVGEGWLSQWLDPSREQPAPLGLFTRGKFQGNYACPTLSKTAATLAASPADVKARLCLAEFWRLNDFDAYLGATRSRPKDELGGTIDLFPGKTITRAALYAGVLADRSAAPVDTAYALYRSIQCYAPSGIDTCGGEVPKAQRKAWFQRLKRDYATSKWAIELQYYW